MTLPHLNTNQKETMVNTIDFNNGTSGGNGGDAASIITSDYNPLVSIKLVSKLFYTFSIRKFNIFINMLNCKFLKLYHF